MSLFQELKRRNVFRVAVAYVITTWLLLQVADVVLGNIDAPGWVFKAIMLVLALGFPVVLIFAWAFELTPEGLKKEKDVDRTHSITPKTGRKLDFVIIALLALGLVYFIWESRFSEKGPDTYAATEQNGNVPGREESASGSAPETSGKSLAVLPFTTRSNIDDDRFFSDGMHDDLLTQLAKIGDLSVISRTSVMEYRDTTKNLRQIGAELGVSAILEGAVQRAGNQVRINVQLIDAQTDKHLWAENFDRELTTDNLFAIQTEIAKAIAAALQATLSPEEEQRIGKNTLTGNLEALRAYQRSRLLGADFEQEDLSRAEQEARTAIALDPGFAAAWAQLARMQLALYWHVETKPEYLQAARESIARGRSIAPELPELDISEGYYHYWGFRDYENALRVLTPVLDAYPNNAEVHELLGFINRRNGAFDQALEHLHRALTLEPRSLIVASALSETYMLLRESQQAKTYLKRTEDIDPGSGRFYATAGQVSYTIDGDPATAARYLKPMQHDAPYDYWLALAAMGKQAEFDAFDDFGTTQLIGEIVYTPALMRGLTLRLGGNDRDALPFLEEARRHYESLLAGQSGDFRLLKPLCVANGAIRDTKRCSSRCMEALGRLPVDSFDRTFHREDIAGALALAGLRDESLDIIEGLMAERAGPTLNELRINPFLTSLHEEPRWKALFPRQ